MQVTAVGEVIAGKYRIEREIGRGGMGVVFAATHLDLEQLVALKVLHEYAAYDQAILSRFLREARAAAKISSDHVVRVMDVGSMPEGGAYIAMELLEGRDLAQVVQDEGPMPVTAAVDSLIEACDAVCAAHAAGIIHRDLKPANLFLAHRPNGIESIKVLDFGVSKILPKAGDQADAGSLTQTGQIFGSPNYMSPEQLRDATDVDGRTDIWALGVVFYELVSGKLPFAGRAMADVLAAVVRDVPASLDSVCSEVVPELAAVIARCLEKEPERRFANVAEFAAALAPFASLEKQALAARLNRDATAASAHSGKLRGVDAFVTPPRGIAGEKRITPNMVAVERGAAAASASDSSTKSGTSLARKWPLLLVGVGLSVGVIAFMTNRSGERSPSLAGSTSSPVPISKSALPVAAAVTTEVVQPVASSTVVAAPTGMAPSTTARIEIITNPAKAQVFRERVLLGVTPITLELAKGTEPVTLKFVFLGFKAQDVKVIPDADRKLSVDLVPNGPSTGKTRSKTATSLPGDLEPF